MRLCLVLGVCGRGRRKIRLTHVGFIFFYFVIVHAFDHCFFFFMGLLLAPFLSSFFKKKTRWSSCFSPFSKFYFVSLFSKFGFSFGLVRVLSVINFVAQRQKILILHTFRFVHFYGFGFKLLASNLGIEICELKLKSSPFGGFRMLLIYYWQAHYV